MFFLGTVIAMYELQEENHFNKRLADLPPDVAMAMRDARDKQKERAHQEAIIERRHQEKVDAIKSVASAIRMRDY